MPLTMTEEREAMIRCQSSFAEDDLFAELDAERAAHQQALNELAAVKAELLQVRGHYAESIEARTK